jgi:hypothetical protein
MPAASEVVRQYALYYAFAFNLDIARPVFERAPDWTIVNGRNTVLLRGWNCAATACPDQGTYNDRGNVDPFHRHMSPDVVRAWLLNCVSTTVSPLRGVVAKQPNYVLYR